MKIKQAKLEFDIEDRLSLDYGRKLRGFFANEFEDVLFHHHKENDKFRYGYPLIQYKILRGKPTVIAIGDGVSLIAENFLEIDRLTLGENEYEEPDVNLSMSNWELSVKGDVEMLPYKYEFITPWMAFNQKNFDKYKSEIQGSSDEKRVEFLSRILIGNILSFAKSIDWWVEEEIKVIPVLKDINVNFKSMNMIGFKGFFFTNIVLPEDIGLGQSSSRGFGTIKEK